MRSQVLHGRLTPINCSLILINFQTSLLSTITSIAPKALIGNAIDLARIANLLGIPTVLTAIGLKSYGGPFLPEFLTMFSNQEPIECTTMSVWEDRRVSREGERTGRRKLVVAGLWTEFCVGLSTIQAIESGYAVYVVGDACGDLTSRAQDAALRDIIQAGAILMECGQVLTELQQHKPLSVPEVHPSGVQKS